MRHELTIADGPRADGANANVRPPRGRVVVEVVRGTRDGWHRIDGDATDTKAAPAVATPVETDGPGALAVVDVSWSAVTVDPEELIATLHAERSAARGGFDHPHVTAGCPFCRRAAAAYR